MTMKVPDQQLPQSIRSTFPPFPRTILDPSIRGDNFDQLLQNRGIRFLHSRAAPCPNMKSLDAGNHDPNCTVCEGNGFLYYDERPIVGVFYSNSLDKLYEAQGVWETGSSIVSFPNVYYDENGAKTNIIADFNAFDRLVVLDYEVRLWELKEYIPTGNLPTVLNTTRVRYPITSIDNLAYVNSSNVLVTLEAGVDYNINAAGQIEWVQGHEPPYNSTTGQGQVLSISYYAIPVYNVVQLLHEQRVTQEMQADGTKTAIRLPQNVLIKREFLMNAPETLSE